MDDKFHETKNRRCTALKGSRFLALFPGSYRNSAMPSSRMRTGWLVYTLLMLEAACIACAFDPSPDRGVTFGFTAAENRQGALSLGALLGSAAIATPLTGNGRRRLRVVIYARYSTEEQNPRSIEDQFAKCRQYLATAGIQDYDEILRSDAGISGERRDRPGINEVWRLIESGGCDLVVAEDGARLYRHSTLAMGLLETAVDAGIRVIAINDQLDTISEGWRLSAFFSSFKSEISNRDTASRIIRAMDGLWRDGFAVGSLRPGYIRIPSHPATEREPARGPFRDVKDEKWTPVIREAFEMAARGDPLWNIAQYLDSQSFPKSSRSTLDIWTDETVRRLLCNTIYSGVEKFRGFHNVKKYKTGRSIQTPTPPAEILYRDMPKLAHVPKWLQARAIEALAKRSVQRQPDRDRAMPLTGILRDSRGPLSLHFFCGICGAKMYREGILYTCADSRRRPTINRKSNERCWNRCKPHPRIVHEQLSKSILGEILHSRGCIEAIIESLPHFLHEGDRTRSKQLREFREKEADVNQRCDRLRNAVEEGSGSTTLIDGLKQREAELDAIRLELARLSAEFPSAMRFPTREEVLRLIDEEAANVLGVMDRAAGPLLRRLISPIRAFPCKQFDSGNVGLRAFFTLHLVELLPEQWRDLLKKDRLPENSGIDLTCLEVPMVVDLFKVPQRIQYASQAAELQQQGRSCAQIAETLNVSYRIVERALETWRRMTAQNIEDPFTLLTDPPLPFGKWRRIEEGRKVNRLDSDVVEEARD